ncbi:MAG: helix-turn-helix transcriptional regulator [Betaproteobacteria bacterium]|nr:helix-turn-helix transcriptional regulator [Betaproteobacteria bacterium]
MNAAEHVARQAALIGDPIRAAVLVSLLDGRAKTASELAMVSGASAQSLSGHLAKLLQGGLLRVVPQGRHRYYSLQDHAVAETIEGLALLASPSTSAPSLFASNAPEHLLMARCCYDHIAGRLGVMIADGLLEQGWLCCRGRNFEMTRAGIEGFAALGLDVNAIRQARRATARACLDWTERKPHVAGALGAALLQLLLDRHWLERTRTPRMLRITPVGRQALASQLKLAL